MSSFDIILTTTLQQPETILNQSSSFDESKVKCIKENLIIYLCAFLCGFIFFISNSILIELILM